MGDESYTSERDALADLRLVVDCLVSEVASSGSRSVDELVNTVANRMSVAPDSVRVALLVAENNRLLLVDDYSETVGLAGVALAS